MKVLIPMAGQGSRFAQAGYKEPKPLIQIGGKSMIEMVVENFGGATQYIFLVRSEHLEAYPALSTKLADITGNKETIIKVDYLTEGAACTALLAKDFINTEEELLIANSDQYLDYDVRNFNVLRKYARCVDGIIFTFQASDPKWSYVKLEENTRVIQVAEKEVISATATCGVYWYRKGADFVKYAQDMIDKKIKTNNEFYIAPVYNQMLLAGKTILPFNVNRMWGLGTPEDLEAYLHNLLLSHSL